MQGSSQNGVLRAVLNEIKMKNKLILCLAALVGLVSCAKGGLLDYGAEAAYDGAGKMAGWGNGPGQGRPGGKAGVLTAGEWNDLNNWDFWSKLMTSQEYGGMADYWGLYTARRVAVRIADAAGNRLPAVRVTLEQDQKTIWTTLTDNLGAFIFLELSCRCCLYIFEISCLSVASFPIIFSHSEGCLFTLLIVCFDVQKLLRLIRSHLFIFVFISNILGGGS